jgi:2-polyprenyl-3-methyl-5-hydroxy-6-metoxy-1,4-benzoquinol methylase
MKLNKEAWQLRVNRDGRPLRLPERFLLALCRPVDAPALPVATYTYTIDNALNFARKTVPELESLIRGKSVLDYGCGPGFQAVAMARAGASHVYGLDINQDWLNAGRSLAETNGVRNIEFGTAPVSGGYDVVVSLNAMEHYTDPAAELTRMLSLTRSHVIVSFCELWYSPYGTHLNGTTRLPWLNLLFSDKTIINVRNLYPDGSDGATRFEEVRGGLNRMTLRRFESMIAGLPEVEVEQFRLRGVKNFNLATKLPLLRELFISSVTCILRHTARN